MGTKEMGDSEGREVCFVCLYSLRFEPCKCSAYSRDDGEQ